MPRAGFLVGVAITLTMMASSQTTINSPARGDGLSLEAAIVRMNRLAPLERNTAGEWESAVSDVLSAFRVLHATMGKPLKEGHRTRFAPDASEQTKFETVFGMLDWSFHVLDRGWNLTWPSPIRDVPGILVALPREAESWTCLVLEPPAVGNVYVPRAYALDENEAHYVGYDILGNATRYAYFQWREDGWYAVEYYAYPNGLPHLLATYRNGVPAGTILWELDGAFRVTTGSLLPAGDPRLHPEASADSPPSALESTDAPPREVVTVTVQTGFGNPQAPIGVSRPPRGMKPPYVFGYNRNSQSFFVDVPALAVHLVEPGRALAVTAPKLAALQFTGWSGDAGGQDSPAVVSAAAGMELVACYDRPIVLRDPTLVTAVRSELGLAYDDALTLSSAVSLTHLQVTSASIEYVAGLDGFLALDYLDLSDNNIEDLDELMPQPDTMTRLAGTPVDQIRSPLNRLLAGLSGTPYISLRTLIVDRNPVDIRYLPILPTLETLSLRDAGLGKAPNLPGLPALRTLVLDANALHTFHEAYFCLPAMERLSLRDNQIMVLPEAPQDALCTRVFAMALEGNPLGEEALCYSIPKLEGMGMQVSCDDRCVYAAVPGVDSDGDGFSDLDERRFTALFYVSTGAREEAATAAIGDPDVPRRYLEALPAEFKEPGADPGSIDAITTGEVNIKISGGGTVPPGTGNHRFARYVLDNETGTWKDQELTFSVMPAADCVLRRLGFERPFSMDQIVELSDQGARVRLAMKDEPQLIRAVFIHVPEPVIVDLLADLNTFIERCFHGERLATFDRNDIAYVRDDDRHTASPDGIPDGALLCLLQETLARPRMGENWEEGATFLLAAKAWRANLAVAAENLGEVAWSHPETPHLMAAYATIDGIFGTEAFALLVEECTGHQIEFHGFDNAMAGWLPSNESIHNHARTNSTIWEQVSEGHEPTPELFEAFTEAVLSQEW